MPDVDWAFNPTTFGAIAGGLIDCSSTFQSALTTAGTSTVTRKVRVPSGTFLFTQGHLTVPDNVTLQGQSIGLPGRPGEENSTTVNATTFLITAGAGQPNGAPFIQLGNNSAVRGIDFFYPNQLQTAASPILYPYTIASATAPGADLFDGASDTQNVCIKEIHLRNSYQGIDLTHAPRHHVSQITGQPMLTGIRVDECSDTSWIRDVEFYVFWTFNNFVNNAAQNVTAPAAAVWIQNNGTGFLFLRSDDQRCEDISAFGYKYGMHFAPSADAGQQTSGSFKSCRTELAGTAGIFIEGNNNSTTSGLRFYDAEPGAITGATGIHVASTYTNGLARFHGGNVANPTATTYAPIVIESGNILLSGMLITDVVGTTYSVRVTGGNTQIQGCIFDKSAKHCSVANAGTVLVVVDCIPTNGNHMDILNVGGLATLITAGNL